MPATAQSTLPPQFVAAEASAASLTLQAVAVHLEAMAACLPPSDSALRGALEVAALDHHLAQAVAALDAAADV